jgi:hypothetical protein
MIAARLSPGAISESSSSHLPASEASRPAKAFPPGRSSRGTSQPLEFAIGHLAAKSGSKIPFLFRKKALSILAISNPNILLVV